MKIQRTKNAARNILYGGMLRVYNMLVPFVMRSIILYTLGVEYLGLSGFFASILSFLNLAELGVGQAMVFSMYRPIAEDDTETICALLGLYRRFYRLIGLFIAGVGLVLTPFLPRLVHGELPPGIDLYVLYFMNLGSTVLTYWLFAYKNSLLHAHQRTDIGSKLALVINTVQNLLKLLVLLVFHNYYLYLLVQLLSQIATNIFTALIVGKRYPQYKPRGSLPKESIRDIGGRVRDLFTAKFAHVIFNSADTLVVSSFMGLVSLATYQNYIYIITALKNLIDVFSGAVLAGVGNSLITESKEKNFRDLQKYSFLYNWMVCVFSVMLLCLYQPFMELWMGRENVLPFGCMLCFVLYFYVVGIGRPLLTFKDAAGMWHSDRFRPLAASVLNLSLNLLTVRRLGLYGVVLSSVVAAGALDIPWLLHNIFRELFSVRDLRRYVLGILGFLLVASVSGGSAWFLCSSFALPLFPKLLVNALFAFAVPNLLIFAVYGRSSLFRESVGHLRRLVRRKGHKTVLEEER